MKRYLIFNWSKSTLNTFSDRNEQYSNWGYQDNPKPMYFFYENILSAQKSTKTQNKRFPPS